MRLWPARKAKPGRPVAFLSNMPPVVGPSAAGIGGTAGWAPMPGAQHPSQQIGVYAGSLLNAFPAAPVGVELHSGREWGSAAYYTPATTYLPNGSVEQTQRPNNVSGGQRYGSLFSGPIGPISAKANAAQVAAAQVRQSGLAATRWAQGLSN